jgi:hypothetical protein
MGAVRTKMSYAAGFALAVALLMGVAGCGQPGQDGSADNTQAPVSVAIQPTIEPLPTAPESQDTSAAAPGDLFDLDAMLQTTSCAPTAGAWSYAGKFTNSTDTDLRITVAVSLVSTADLKPVTLHEVDLTVPAGESRPVVAKDFYRDPALDPAKVECLTGVTDKDG